MNARHNSMLATNFISSSEAAKAEKSKEIEVKVQSSSELNTQL